MSASTYITGKWSALLFFIGGVVVLGGTIYLNVALPNTHQPTFMATLTMSVAGALLLLIPFLYLVEHTSHVRNKRKLMREGRLVEIPKKRNVA